jgi:uncharacterized protein YkwD
MRISPRMLLAFLLAIAAATVHAPASGQSQPATLKPVAAMTPDIPFNQSELQAEQQLLMLANQSRHEAGVGPLTLDAGLSKAARIHAQAMLEARQLSHQFHGEAALPQRLAAMTHLLLDQEGENVALDYDAEHGHEHLMLSAPHRANLLNPAYNVVGLGVVRSGDRLYIVQDFGHSLPHYSSAEAKDRIAAAVNHLRQQAGQAELTRQEQSSAEDAACSMAQADELGTSAVRKLAARSTVLTYTSVHPETLPNEASQAISGPNLHHFSVGTCYNRSETYPTGMYWVVLTLD